MLKNKFTLESLLQTHDAPFVIIDSNLQIVAVNSTCENYFGVSASSYAGQPCCSVEDSQCRHQRLFNTLEPYSGLFSCFIANNEESLFQVRGYPLMDSDGTLYIGELITTQGHLKNKSVTKMVGSSEVFLNFKNKLKQAASSFAPVMLTGETGTGKELAAEFIHNHSHVAGGELIVVDCTTLGEDLFESELFGHEKGSFTGATVAKRGLLELANKGTLFLDEIGELPLPQQPKLLRVLETGQFRRVGGTSLLRSEVRIVCATHRNLVQMVKEGRFREDLFYRLSVFPLQIPALRERKQDLPALIDHFLIQLGQQSGKIYSVSKPALRKLLQHNWPGNIRELKNCIQLAVGLKTGPEIAEQDIHISQLGIEAPIEVSPFQNNVKSDNLTLIDKIETDFIKVLIQKYKGNRKLIATEMSISERTLYRKLNRYNLN